MSNTNQSVLRHAYINTILFRSNYFGVSAFREFLHIFVVLITNYQVGCPVLYYQNQKQESLAMEQGFIKANSSNLPMIDLLMLGEFLASNKDFCSAEFRNVKTSM